MPRPRPRLLLAAAAAIFALSLLTGGRASAEESVVLHGHIAPETLGATRLERVPPGEAVELILAVRLDQTLLDQTINEIYGPGAPKNKSFLSSADFARKFDVAAKRKKLKDFARAAGFAVGAEEDRSSSMALRITGTSDLVEKTFQVHMHHYRSRDGQVFRANADEPSIPASLAPHLGAVLGMSNFLGANKPLIMRGRTRSAVAAAAAAAPGEAQPQTLTGMTGPNNGMSPSDINKVYNLVNTGLNGSNQSVALIEFDGYTASDYTAYDTHFSLPTAPVTFVGVGGATANMCGPNLNMTCNATTLSGDFGGMAEVELDIQMVSALAPSIQNIYMYTAVNTGAYTYYVYAQIAYDNAAKIVSSSWGGAISSGNSSFYTAEGQIFQQMAIQGQTIYAAAGDQGAFPAGGETTPDVIDPSAQPYVTGVGGTGLSGAVTSTNSIVETVWNDGYDSGTGYFEGGGGGVASTGTFQWPIPSYQAALSTSASFSPQMYSAQYRNVPDVSLNAEPNNSPYAIYVGGGWTNVGGTSAAAPLWAALTALVDQQRATNGYGPLGFANPVIYQLGTSSSYTNVFRDITTTNNGYYNAGTQYDNASGWGSFKGAQMIAALSSLTPVPTAPLFSQISTGTIYFGWSANGNPVGQYYTAQTSTASNFSGTISSQSVTVTTAAFGGLSADTSYYFRVQSVGGSFLTVAVPTMTLAEPPTSAVYGAASATSIPLSWNADGNPSGATIYSAQITTNGFTTVNSSSVTLNVSATISGLTPNTTYAMRVEAINGGGVSTTFDSLSSTVTLAALPTAPSAAVSLSSIVFSWNADGNPSGTSYIAQISANGFSTVGASSQTLNASATFSSLSANTTYSLRVQALNSVNAPTAFTAILSTMTLAAAPTSIAYGAPTAASIPLTWNANGNPAGTIYIAQISTNGFTTVNSSSQTLNASATFSGLSANTTYSVQVEALNGGGVPSAVDALSSTATLTNPPTSPTLAAVNATSIVFAWNADGNPSGTTYVAQISTNNFIRINSSSSTLNTSATFAGLLPNDTYFLQVEAVNADNIASAFTSIVSTWSAPAAPLSAPLSSVTTSSATANWGSNGDAPGTFYAAEISTDNFGTLNASSVTLNLYASFSGLNANTAYYFRVAAQGNNGSPTAFTALPSTTTALLEPAAAVATFTAVSAAALTVQWGSGGNGAGTAYDAQISTDDFNTVNASSITLNLSATFASLSANVTYYLQVQSSNSFNTSAFFSLGSTVTPADVPTLPTFAGVYLSSVAFAWNAGGNPAGTLYVARISTDGFATQNASSQTYNTSASFLSLDPNATYYLQVKAKNFAGASTAFTSASSTMTLAAQPAGAAYGAPTNAAIPLTWNANGDPAGTLYVAQISTNGFATVNAASQTLNAFASFSGLSPNTTYSLQVEALNGDGIPSGFDALSSTVTLASVPTSPAVAGAYLSSVAFAWNADSNPPGTVYVAQISTDGFITVNASSVTFNVSAAFTALFPNVTYYLQAQALNSAGAPTADAAIISTMSLAAAPTSLAYGAPSNSSIALAWNRNGDPAGTLFVAEISTNGFATVNSSSQTLNTSATFSGLGPNTTYSVEVAAVNGQNIPSAFSSAGSTATLANAPASPSVAAVYSSSISFAWNSGGDPAGTAYVAQISTDNFLTVNASSSTLNASATFYGLLPDDTYFFQVEAVNAENIPSAYSSVLSTWTAAAAPLSASPTVVTASSVTIDWGANGDAAGTFYLAQISTNGFATLNASSVTLNASASFTGLSANTAYNFRVAAQSNDGILTAFTNLPSTTTLLLEPAAAAAAFTAVNAASLTVQWTSGGNGAGTAYVAQISTNDFSTVNASSLTLNTSATFYGLLPNTLYFLQVQSSNSVNASAFFSLGSTVTPANIPTAPAFSGVYLSSVSFAWNAGGNPNGTVYVAQISTNNFLTVNSSSSTLNASATFYSLNANTSYYLQVQAFNSANSPTAETAIVSTMSLAAQPSAAAYGAPTSTSIPLTWSANGNPSGTIYIAQISTNGFATVNSSSQTLNTSAAFSTLSVNTTYSIQVKALNGEGIPSAFSALASTATLANAPTSPSLAGVYQSSIAFAWNADSNPAGTTFVAQISTNDFSTINASSSPLNAAATFSGLSSNATYFLQVEAVNADNIASAFTSVLSTWTAPAVPLSASPTTVTASSVAVDWGANGDAAGTFYLAQISTNGFSTLNASSVTLNAFASFSGLTANTAYNFRVAAQGNDGLPTAFTNLPSTTTLLLEPGAAVTTFTAVSAGSLTVQWTSGGNGAGTTYVAQISTNDFSTLNASSATLNTFAIFSGLNANTTYFLQVQASNGSNASAFLPLASTVTAAAAPTAPAFAGVFLSSVSFAWNAGSDSPGTTYVAQISTNGFATVNASSVTLNASASFIVLSPNTSYYLQVEALNSVGVPSAFTTPASTMTLAAQPSAPAYGAATSTSIPLSWSANGNPSGTLYVAQLSTNAFITLNASSATQNAFATFSGLSANATYSLQVKAVNGDGLSSLTASPGLTATLANAPTAPSLSGVYQSSIAFAWNADSNPPGTTFVAQISTNDFGTINASSSTLNASATFYALLSNATYFVEVEAIGGDSIPTAFTSVLSTWTAVAAPLSAAPTVVTASSVTVDWGTNGDAAGTFYLAEISTNGFATLNASSVTLNAFASFTGLSANTAYNFRVAAQSNNGTPTVFTNLPSTTTLLLEPTAAAATFTAFASSGITVQWNSGGNGAGTTYVLELSLTDFGYVNASSVTLNTSATFYGLVPNTTFFAQVQSSNSVNSSAFLYLGSTITAANPPTVPSITGAFLSSITFQWNDDFNPVYTQYVAQISTNDFETFNSSNQTANLLTHFTSLNPNTTYFLQVQALSSLNVPTAETPIVSAMSLAAQPSAAAYGAPTSTSIPLTWNANGNPPGTIYVAQISTNGFATINSSSQTLNAFAAFSGLAVNTTYSLQVEALNGEGIPSAFSSPGSTATLANAPTSPTLAGVYLSSIAFAWNADSNPAGTTFVAQISTNNFLTLNASSATLNASATFAGLSSNATYFLQVEAVDAENVASAFTSVVSTWTAPAAPLSASPISVTASSVTLAWGASGDAAGTFYLAEISTNGFSTLNASSVTLNAFASFSGLTANTAYNFRVAAQGNDGLPTAFTNLPSTTTLLLEPGAAVTTFTAVSASALTVQWTSGGNGAGTTYVAQISTDDFNTVNASSATLNLSAAFGALSPNTLYFLQVQTSNGSNASLFESLGSTATPANIPASAALVSVYASSLAFAWNADANPGNTVYTAQISTNGFLTYNASSQTLNTSAIFAALTPDATYSVRVEAQNSANVPTGYTGAISTLTAAAQPAAAYGAPTNSSIPLTWNTNGNAFGTVYIAQISTNGFVTVNSSSQTLNAFATFSGLGPNTTYSLQVEALNADGVPSAFSSPGSTATLANAPTAPSLAAVYSSSISFSWNADANPVGTTFTAEISTNDFLTVNASSSTLNASATFTGLLPNATYYLQVESVDAESVASPFTSAVSTWTAPAVPLSALPISVTASSVTISWGSDGDAPGTFYVAQVSTNNFLTYNASSVTLNAFASFTGLTANTAYSFQVAAQGNDGAPTAFAALPSTTTLLLEPAAAASPFTAVGAAALTVHWAAGGNGAGTAYVAQISTDGFNTVNASSATLNLSATFSSLSPNTTYFLEVEASNGGNSSVFDLLGSTVTLPQTPTVPAQPFSNQTASGFAFSFNSAGNAPGTDYVVEVSTDPLFSVFAASASAASTSASFTGLLSNQLYYAEAAALSPSGAATPFTAPAATATAVAAPVPALAPVPVFALTSFTAAWAPGTLAPGTTYLAQISSSPVFATITANATTTGTSAGFAGLWANTTYFVQVQALSRNAPTPNGAPALVATPATLANAPPAGAFASVTLSTASVCWTPLPPSPSSATAESYRVDLATAANFSGTLVSSAVPFGASCALLAGLNPATIYYGRVGALNWEGYPDYLTIGSTTTGTLAYASSGTVTSSSGLSLVVASVVPQIASIQVAIPPGAFPAGTSITAVADPAAVLSGASSNEAVIVPLGVGVGFDLSAGGLQPGAPVTVSFGYDTALFPPGQSEQYLHLMRFDPVAGQWTLVPSQADTVAHVLTAAVPHFSLYAPFFVAPAAAANLASVQIFPQPWEEGGNASSLYWNSTLNFSSLPSGATVRLFTVAGELVWEGTASPSGVLTWDGSNRFGRKAGSGTYIAVIEAGGARIVRRVVVIR